MGDPSIYSYIINMSYKEEPKLDLNLSTLKECKSVSYEDTFQVPAEKPTFILEQGYSVEEKLEKTANELQKFQINSLSMIPPSRFYQRIQSNTDIPGSKIELDPVQEEMGKVEVRESKRKKLFHLESLLKSHREFLDCHEAPRNQLTFSEYTRRRVNLFPNISNLKTDLGLYNIREVVEFCSDKNIISLEVYAEYTFEPCFTQEELFVERLNRKLYEKLQFEKMYFTPFDHRLLCKILVHLFPEQFQFPTLVTLENPKLTNFYSYLYSLSQAEYLDMVQNLNRKYNRTWIPDEDWDLVTATYTRREYRPQERFTEKPIFIAPPRKLRKKY